MTQFLIEDRPNRKEADYMFSVMSKRKYFIINKLENIGGTFRLCIYIGIVVIIGLILNNFWKLGIIEYGIILLFIIQSWGLFLNVHRFKEFYELDLEEEIEEEKINIESLNKAMIARDYKILTQTPNERKNSLFQGLILDLKSLFKIK